MFFFDLSIMYALYYVDRLFIFDIYFAYVLIIIYFCIYSFIFSV